MTDPAREPASISVIIAAYNAEATIGRTLASVLAQTRASAEVLVVDDGSTDRTAAVVGGFADRDPRVRLFRERNAGPMRARNLAVDRSRGGYLAPIDADDLWRPDFLHQVAGALDREQEAGFAYALHRIIDPSDRVLRDGADFGVEGRAFLRHLLVNFVGNGSSAVFRRSAFLEAGGYDERTRAWGGGEDYLVQLRIAARRPVARVGLALTGYRASAESYSSDPTAACRARLLVVRTAAEEHGLLPADVMRWVRSNAFRVLAAQRLKAGDGLRAIGPALAGTALDPAATIEDFVLRLRNAWRRAARGRPAGDAPGPLFADRAADDLDTPSPGLLLDRRLARLAAREPSAAGLVRRTK